MRTRVMVIGWDSCDFNLMTHWIGQGFLPTVKGLIDNGKFGRLLSVYPPVTANAWSTIVTGRNAGKHGVFEFASFKKGTYDAIPLNASNRCTKDVWEILGGSGKKVVIIGVPMTYPVRKVNGIMVSGFLTPNERVTYTYPSELKQELQAKIPGYQTNPSSLFDYEGDLSEDEYVASLFKVLESHIEGAKYLVRNKEWDFFMGVFNETDWVQHKFWSAIDSFHPKYSTERARKFGNVILDVYSKLDQALKELIEIAGNSTHVMLISDHGAGPQYKKLITNNFLFRNGFLKFKRDLGTSSRLLIANAGINPASAGRWFKSLRLSKPKQSEKDLNKLLPSAKKFFISRDDIDWSRTLAFAPYGSGQIYINRLGYFPLGSVDESAYSEIREKVRQKLLELSDDKTKVVERVFFKEELYDGEKQEAGPDIQFHCIRGYFPVGSFSHGSAQIFADPGSVSGAHSMDGIFLLKEAGNNEKVEVKDARLVDIVPTILHLAGVLFPSGLDGKSLSSSKGLISYETSSDKEKNGEHYVTSYSKEEQEDIEDRLRSLGYV